MSPQSHVASDPGWVRKPMLNWLKPHQTHSQQRQNQRFVKEAEGKESSEVLALRRKRKLKEDGQVY
jgi:hypothetical protein